MEWLVYAFNVHYEAHDSRLQVEERLELADGVLGAGNGMSLSPRIFVDLIVVSACSTGVSASRCRRESRARGRGGGQGRRLTLVGLVAEEVDLLEVLLHS